MRKYLFLLLFLTGCTTARYDGPLTVLPSDACRSVEKFWWGVAGQNPGESDLWKCYDWQLEAR
jgi:hypothetical protein